MNIKICALALAALSLTACSKDDGDWDPIKWSTDYLTFSAEGGTQSVYAKNYSSVWIAALQEENETKLYYVKADTLGYNFYHDAIWLKAGDMKSAPNTIEVTVEPNTTTATRKMYITGQSGDAFGRITVIQLGKTEESK